MPLWELDPIDFKDRNWARSTYKGGVIVRARDSRHARQLAARAYGIAVNHQPGESVKANPWTQSDCVSVIQVPATGSFPEDGDLGVVYPREALAAVNS